jgi:hypothetical protein
MEAASQFGRLGKSIARRKHLLDAFTRDAKQALVGTARDHLSIERSSEPGAPRILAKS